MLNWEQLYLVISKRAAETAMVWMKCIDFVNVGYINQYYLSIPLQMIIWKFDFFNQISLHKFFE